MYFPHPSIALLLPLLALVAEAEAAPQKRCARAGSSTGLTSSTSAASAASADDSSTTATATSTSGSSGSTTSTSLSLACTPTAFLNKLYAISDPGSGSGSQSGVMVNTNTSSSADLVGCYGSDSGCGTDADFRTEFCSVQDDYTAYGHLLHYDSTTNTTMCVAASAAASSSSSPSFNNSALVLADCVYDDTIISSGQYWVFQHNLSLTLIHLYDSDQNVYGPTPDIANDGALVLFQTELNATSGTASTWFSYSNSESADPNYSPYET